MSRVERADWAAQVPATGIVGKIPADVAPGAISDIGQLTANGFSAGTVARWNGTKFVPYTIPASTTPVNPTSTVVKPIIAFVTWDVSTLRPLESDSISIPLPGVTLDTQIVVGIPVGMGFVNIQAYPTSPNTVQLTITNMSGSVITLINDNYQFWLFN